METICSLLVEALGVVGFYFLVFSISGGWGRIKSAPRREEVKTQSRDEQRSRHLPHPLVDPLSGIGRAGGGIAGSIWR